ncbi:MAG: hypothetical protein J2P25_19755 [Nocardiopsaceae bacterium]|nr:hypothetical protein [Nocardiopsaceae bacterium]
MSSELYSGGADRPGRPDRGDRGDRLRDDDDPGPDVTPVPASADHRAPGITRQEAYAAVGQADQTPNAFLRRDAGSRDEPGKGQDAQGGAERGAERSGADQSGAERRGADQPGAGWAGAGQSGADRGQGQGDGARDQGNPAVGDRVAGDQQGSQSRDGQLPETAAGVRPGDGQPGEGQPGDELRGPEAGEGIRPVPGRPVPGEVRGPGADGVDGAGGADVADGIDGAGDDGPDRGGRRPFGRGADAADPRDGSERGDRGGGDQSDRGDQDASGDGRRSRPDAGAEGEAGLFSADARARQAEGATAGRDGTAEGVTPADRERTAERDQAGADRERVQPQSQDQAQEQALGMSPEARTDHQRMTEGTEGDQRMQAVIADLEAKYKAEADSLRAENAELKQQLGVTNAKLDEQGSKLDAILAALSPDKAASPREAGEPEDPDRADADQRNLQPSPDRPQDEDRDRPEPPERPDKPDATKPDKRNDALGTNDDEVSDDAGEADPDRVDRRADDKSGKEGVKGSLLPERHRFFTAENVGALGAALALGQSVFQVFGSVPPEVGVGAAGVAFVGATMATKIQEIFHKMRRKG